MSSSKRMVLNTGVMYGKMFISIIISLYTSRVVLDALGVVNYGVYNVVGGVVTMFNFINSSLASASQRYITYEIGKGAKGNVQKLFSASMYSHIGIALIIFLIIEIIGLWFFNRFINVPEERLGAAIFVFHFSALSLVFNLLLVPYRALINAHERMVVIAIIDTANVIFKLLAVFYLIITPFDKLKVHGVNFFLITFLTFVAYYIICRRRYKETKLIRVNDKKLFKELFSFGGFNLLGSLSIMARNQGFTILINLFFGPVLNAAFGIANQINMQLRNLTSNIHSAINPQLVKRFASGEYERMISLTYQSSKFSFYVFYLISSILYFNMSDILGFWLKEPPPNSDIICKLIIINALMEVTAQPIMLAIQASGKIKMYQIVIGGLNLLNIPISFLLLKVSKDFRIIFYVNIILTAVAFYARLYFAKKHAKIVIRHYFKNVLLPITLVAMISTSLILLFRAVLPTHTFTGLLAHAVVSLISSTLLIYYIGLSSIEKDFFSRSIQSLLRKVGLKKITQIKHPE